MASIQSMVSELDERAITQQVSIKHDETRIKYRIDTNTVNSYTEFSDRIGNYCNYHFITCVSNGGALSESDAASRAKKLLEQEYRRNGRGDIVAAYNDARDGTNGGLRRVLDIIAEGLKSEAVDNYVTDVFDRYIEPNSWEQKVDMIRQFIAHCGVSLSRDIQTDKPERYASNYKELINSYVQALRQTSSIFRRL